MQDTFSERLPARALLKGVGKGKVREERSAFCNAKGGKSGFHSLEKGIFTTGGDGGGVTVPSGFFFDFQELK